MVEIAEKLGRPFVIHSVGALQCALLIGLVGLFIAKPLGDSRKVSANQAEQLEQLVGKNRRMYAELEELREEFAETEKRADTIRQRIPANREEAELLENLSELAKEHQVLIEDYRRGEVTRTEQFSRMQVQLQCLGSFGSICQFLADINSLKRLSTIDSLAITTAEDPARYPVELTIALYHRPAAVANVTLKHLSNEEELVR